MRHQIVHAIGKRRCHECERVRPLSRFTNKGYLCVDCQWFYMARYDQGIARQDLERILVEQNGRCAICIRKCRERRNLCVDHDHGSGVVRGLLCTRCNTAISLFSDDRVRMRRAVAYLRGPAFHPMRRPCRTDELREIAVTTGENPRSASHPTCSSTSSRGRADAARSVAAYR